jgi:HEAT repeat protein
MNTYPTLTILLLSQLTNRELQFNYLNHLDRTSEVASLLTQITDPDLALRIVNLALEVDLCLGAKLTASIEPALQQIIVDGIDLLEIPTRLKIELLRITKSKAALSYIHNLFAVKNQYQRTSIYDHNRERDSIVYESMDAIIDLDPNLAANLLIETLCSSNGFYDVADDRITRIAISDADTAVLTELTKARIDILGYLLDTSPTDDYYNYECPALDALGKIGTESAITKIRDILNEDKSLWLNPTWIKSLGIVGESPMVEHLLYLLYFTEEYIDRPSGDPITNEDNSEYDLKTNTLRCEAILGIEKLGGDLAFDILHQSLYSIADRNNYPAPWGTITQALFRLDCDRILKCLEQAICDRDPAVRLRVVNILGSWYIDLDDRHLSILLNAIEEPDLDIRDRIAFDIRAIIKYAQNPNRRMRVSIDITPQLLDLAKTNPVFATHDFYRELATKDIGDRAVQREFLEEGDRDFIKLLNISQLYRLISDVNLIELIREPDYIWSDFRSEAIVQMGKIGGASALPKLISLLEDTEFSIREAAVKGIVEIGAIDIIPTLLSLASDSKLATTLIWHLELMRKGNIKTPALDLLLADRELASNLLDIAEKTIIDTAIKESNNSVGLVFCLGAIGSTNESVLVLDKLIKGGYHHFHYVLRSLARIDNQLAIDKLSEYLFADSEKANHMGGELRQVYKLGIVPHLWKCERNHYSGSVLDIIETIQEKEGLYNPDFSDRTHPLFEPYTARLRYFLSGDKLDNSYML